MNENEKIVTNEDGCESLCGISPTVYKSRVLFTEQIVFKLTELPRWKPQIRLSRRDLME